MLYYKVILRLKGVVMDLVYVGVALIVGLVIGALFLDVDSISNLWAKKEEEIDEKAEHEEAGK